MLNHQDANMKIVIKDQVIIYLQKKKDYIAPNIKKKTWLMLNR